MQTSIVQRLFGAAGAEPSASPIACSSGRPLIGMAPLGPPLIEGLEGRVLFAVSVNVVGGVLVITGDSAANNVIVAEEDLISGDEIMVDRDANLNWDDHILISDITQNRIKFVGGGGGETILFGHTNDWMGGDQPVSLPASLYGDAGNDTLQGTDNGDIVYGGDGADSVFMLPGEDLGYGEEGSDWFDGEAGDDLVYGGTGYGVGVSSDTAGHDTLNGSIGEDSLYGEGGNDSINGGADADYLYGGDGGDTINAANGDGATDTLNGGSGSDAGFWDPMEDSTISMEVKL